MRCIRKVKLLFIPLLLFPFLLGAVGFSVDMHFCKGELKTFALFGEAPSCHAQQQTTPSCESSCCLSQDQSPRIKRIPCCQNQCFHFQNAGNSVIPTVDVEHTLGLWKAIMATRAIKLPTSRRVLTTDYLNPRPPILQRSSACWLQVFRL